MIKKILIIFTIMMLVMVSTTPALAKQPPNSNGKSELAKDKGNSGNQPAKENNSGNDSNSNKPVIAEPEGSAPEINPNTDALTTQQNTTHGFDDSGYNRTARIFNGTAWDWCMEKVGDEAWCEEYYGDVAFDHLIMKWNAEWDRGNEEGWSNPPYNAWENNQWNGKVPGGSGDVWHYKIVWVGSCGPDMTPLDNGGYCIWGQFEVIMDQGTSDGMHSWFAHAIPTGYGSYP
jgi:hypothetical protein